jgi:hypothetical protein
MEMPSQRGSIVKKWVNAVRNSVLRDKLGYGSYLIIFLGEGFLLFSDFYVL